jgi:diguanylate cyclase (GGDEF)-like protein
MNNSTSQAAAATYKLCQKSGFGSGAVAKRLGQMNLTEADLQTAEQVMQQVIKPGHKQIMDDFYEFVLGQAEMRPFIGAEKKIKRLKQTQTEYLLSFGLHFNEQAYFEYRLRIGAAHARINMPMHLYIAAYSKMQSLLHQALQNLNLTDTALNTRYHQFINKIIFLDISLAIDAYHMSTMQDLSESVSQLEEEKHELSNQLMHDTLTGALSRAYIMDVLKKHISIRRQVSSQELSVALFDIDFFKKVNDTYGHQVGDMLLIKLIQTINYVIRDQDYLGRYGGEEFLFVIVNTAPEDAYHLVERIRSSIENTAYHINGHEIHITLSIGLTHIKLGDDVSHIIERADSALYQAKNAGRNQTVEVK